MSNLKVLIVGASVAGPTAAYWLAKAGAHVTIIERFPTLRMNGQSIDIRNSGVTVMRKMDGMEPAVRAKTVEVDGISFITADGRPFATMKATGDPDQQSLVSEFEIFRGDLSQILYDMTKDNERIKYVFGEQVTSMQQKDDESITVEFANGLPSSEYDLVVACDGATSRTRAIGLGCGVRDHIIPQNAWSAYFTIDQDILNGSKMAQSYSTAPGRFFGVGPDPTGGNRVVLMSILPRGEADATLPFQEAVKQGGDMLKTHVAKRFEGAGWKADEILKGMMKTDDFYASEMVQVKVPSLFRGRFVLVGDAGYGPGPIGTGTSLALTGAYLLAGEVCSHKGDLEAGLRGYEERMRPILKDMQKIPPGIPGLFAPQTAWGIWLRNLLFSFVAWSMKFKSTFAWLGSLFSSSFGSDKFELPDYLWEF
ncbi:FAD/NAD(P)-binding domain-containing protein [Polychaeton citri CBS 116435]|uniref:FAD/NAD(P)-binding domain-containing protein n=1 Tax=Polychaeton citri CBS 116435 TaxID=1314669 RepID=A0A9P4UTJ9_9PEZI|nr:FAD/NAD(P)-binding domain-containing protein [Polychaeton citri CBS 116435]